jgi:opacity protein-like surface antigen
MRLWVGLAAGTVAAFGFGACAQAETPFYVSGAIGGYFRESDSIPDEFSHSATPNILVNGTDRRGFDSGFIGDLALGYRLNAHVRLEGEFSYFTYTGSTLNPATTAAGFSNLNGQTFSRTSGDRFSRYTGAANAFYDFTPLAGRFTPYVGGGVGASRNHQTVGYFEAADGVPFRAGGGSSTQGLGFVEGGVSIAISRELSLVPAYRYVRFFAGNQDAAHVAKVGLRYQF